MAFSITFVTTKGAHIETIDVAPEPVHLPEVGDYIRYMHKSGNQIEGRVKKRSFLLSGRPNETKSCTELELTIDVR